MKFAYDHREIDRVYHKDCDYIHIYQPTGTHLLPFHNIRHLEDLNGKYVSIIQILFMQLCTDSIYKSMHFLCVKDNSGFIKWKYLLKFKLQCDGFVYNLKSRSNILITLSNCSVRHTENSRNCCSIIALIDAPEDRWTLSLVSQNLDLELMYLNILGIVCPRTGKNIGIICFNVQDTGSLEKTFGKDGASGLHRWHLSRENYKIHWQQWFRSHVPISVDVKLAEDIWRKFERDVLKPHLRKKNNNGPIHLHNIHLCEFNTCSKSIKYICDHQSEFLKIRRLISQYKNSTYGFIGNWQGAKSVWTFGADGLHLALRIYNITLKRVILFSLEYSTFLKNNQEYIKLNHTLKADDEYKIMSEEQILRHFEKCCCISFSYDSQQPQRLRIKAGICTKIYIQIYIYIYIYI